MIRELDGWGLWLAMAAGAAILVLSGCADTGNLPATSSGEATWTTLTAPGGIFATSCQACHPTVHSPSLANDQYTAIVTNGELSTEKPSLKLIDAVKGKGSSYLYLKMIGDPSIASTAVMPISGVLDSSKTDQVGAWIDAGAPEK